MKPFTLLIILFSASTLFVDAQSKYYPAQIVLANGETLNAEVYYEDWVHSPQSIKVKTDSKTTEYYAKDLKELSIPALNLIYSSQYIKFNYITKKVVASYSELIEETAEGYFLMTYVVKSDRLSLFQFVDARDVPRFFIKKDNDIIELQSYEFMILVKGVPEKRTNTEYKNQLINTLLINDNSELKTLKYERKELANFLTNYLSSQEIEHENFAENTTFKSKIIYGYGLGTAGLQNFKHGSPPSNMNLGFNVYNLLANKNHNRFINLELYHTPIFKSQTPQFSKINQTTLSVSFGQFIGKKNIQATFSMGAFYVANRIKREIPLGGYTKEGVSTFNIAPSLGFSYKKTWILELVRPVIFLGGKGIQQDPQIRLKFLPHSKRID